MRVRIKAGVDAVSLAVDGQKAVKVSAASLDGRPRTVESKQGTPIAIDGKPYRGELRLVPVDGGTQLDVVNVVAIDDYLRGVLPEEVYASWPDDALRSQAVVARTYALYEVQDRRDSNRHFDLHPDDRSQVYGGVGGETPATNRAVDATAGLVLAYGKAGHERVFKAYFSSTCGGVTQSAADAFGSSSPDAIPPLAARDSPDGCSASSRYRWDKDVVLPKAELARRIKTWATREEHPLREMKRLRTIEVSARNAHRRPSRFAVVDETGRRHVLTSEQARWACNAGRADGPFEDRMLWSSYVEPRDAGDAIRFADGRGWGHGVGMCQWCAAGWSKRGASYTKILEVSYPGAILVRAY